MSTQAVTWAFDRQEQGLTIAQKFLLVALANSADKSGVTWIGQAALAEDCVCKRETVSRNMVALEEAGFIRRVRRCRANGSRTSDYTILAPRQPDRGSMTNASPDEFPEEVVALARPCECESHAFGLCDPRTDSYVTETGGPEPSGEPSVSSPSGEDTARAKAEPLGFEDWLEHHAQATDSSIPAVGTKRRAQLAAAYGSLTADGFNPDDFIAATRAVTTEWHRERGHDSFETVLRKTEFGAKVRRGRAEALKDRERAPMREKYDGMDGAAAPVDPGVFD